MLSPLLLLPQRLCFVQWCRLLHTLADTLHALPRMALHLSARAVMHRSPASTLPHRQQQPADQRSKCMTARPSLNCGGKHTELNRHLSLLRIIWTSHVVGACTGVREPGQSTPIQWGRRQACAVRIPVNLSVCSNDRACLHYESCSRLVSAQLAGVSACVSKLAAADNEV